MDKRETKISYEMEITNSSAGEYKHSFETFLSFAFNSREHKSQEPSQRKY